MNQRIIGITGGVGMGKTTVSNYLATVHQLPVLDADLYAREAVEPGSSVLEAIATRHGSKVFQPDGSLDRRRLGEIIFADPTERLWLEQQIHPFVRDRMTADLHRLKETPIAVAVIPLLFEARMTDLVTEIWVVQSSPAQQQQRLLKRDRLDLEQVHRRIASQMPIEEKIAQADVVLANFSTVEALLQQVEAALKQG
ncbi:dephospho-CoA kinase [Phormidium tenue FACHB-886]|nr:dephospho-CoA kinase [Phormidium tenue FACHB-886]